MQPRKIRIRGYKSNGKRLKKYDRWGSNNDSFNPFVLKWDGSQPWSQKQMSPLEEDYYEALENLRLILKGRQRQIVDALMEETLNQSEIGRRLGIARKDVVIHLRRIAKKILKIVRGSVV